VEVVASLSQGRTAAAQCGLFTHKSVPVIFEPPCIYCIPTFGLLCISAEMSQSQEVHCLGGDTDITLLLVSYHCPYVYKIQGVINFEVYKALCK